MKITVLIFGDRDGLGPVTTKQEFTGYAAEELADKWARENEREGDEVTVVLELDFYVVDTGGVRRRDD